MDMCNEGEKLTRITVQFTNERADLDQENPLFQLSNRRPDMLYAHFEVIAEDVGRWAAISRKCVKEIKERPIGSNQPVLPSCN